jgi:hypothetical protein
MKFLMPSSPPNSIALATDLLYLTSAAEPTIKSIAKIALDTNADNMVEPNSPEKLKVMSRHSTNAPFSEVALTV